MNHFEVGDTVRIIESPAAAAAAATSSRDALQSRMDTVIFTSCLSHSDFVVMMYVVPELRHCVIHSMSA